jgi:L-aspartate oxidase
MTLPWKAVTGLEIERTLLKQVHDNKNITLYSHHFAVDLITQHHLGEDVRRGEKGITCYGAYVLDLKSGIVETVLSRITLVAAGGAGHIYSSTTNPVIATGDGVAMVYRAKGEVDHMEFIQFHPTALYNPGEHPSFLISEAMRGSGAILRLADGTDFMLRYDPRGSLAPRDIVARGIDSEMKKSGEDHVFLDCTMIPREELERHFPNIMEKCQKIGYNISNEWIPVLPAAHFFCGGIKVDENGKSTLDRLYAIGECSSTGLHGANRLASNSLLEAAVFSHRAYLHGSKMFMDYDWNDAVPDWNAEGTSDARELVLVSHNLKTLQAVMSDYVGIVRSDARLKKALDRLRIIYGETEAFYENTVISKRLCELRNLINVAYLVVKASMERKENIGLFFNADLTGSDNKTNEIHP